MNEVQSIYTGKGILKDSYDPQKQRDAISDALEKKRKKLAETKLGVDNYLNSTDGTEMGNYGKQETLGI